MKLGNGVTIGSMEAMEDLTIPRDFLCLFRSCLHLSRREHVCV